MKYFTEKELACKCCGVDKTTPEFKEQLEILRKYFDEPMKVNCAYRCKKHNKEVGGEPNSYHTKGMAVDIHCPDSSYKAALAHQALEFGWTVGVYETFLHLDIRDERILFRGKY